MLYGKNLKYIIDPEKNIENLNDEIIWVKQIDIVNIFLDEKKLFLRSQMHNREICMYGDVNWDKEYEPQSLVFEVKGLATYFFKIDDPILYFSKHSDYQEDKVTFWLYHTILPLFLMMQEQYEAILHCGSIDIDGKAILFIAPPMGGKSTLTDYFISQGHTMIADDRVAISHDNNIFKVTSSYPFCRPYRKFEDLGKSVDKVSDSPLPICAIYILERVEKNAEVEVSKVNGVEKFQLLAKSNEVNFSYQKPKVLNVLANMANTIPVYKLSIPWSKDRLDEVYTTVIKHNF